MEVDSPQEGVRLNWWELRFGEASGRIHATRMNA